MRTRLDENLPVELRDDLGALGHDAATLESDAILSKRHSVMEMDMGDAPVRSTIYLDPSLHQALRMKAAIQHRSMSDIVNDAVRSALREDQEDLAAFEDRAAEQPISYEALLARLKADGTL